MATRNDFVKILEEICANHGVYIGTGNGELLESLTIKQIKDMEKAYGGNPPTQTRRVLAFIGSCYEKGYDMSKAIVGDCSGIIVYALLTRLHLIKYDMRAKDFQAKAIKVKLTELKPGDLVFNASTNCSHVGVYVGNGYVIESRGRDNGVIKGKLAEGPWIIGGRFDWWEDDVVVFNRNLKYVKGAIMVGEDVRKLQTKLIELGYLGGSADGEFGPKTDKAVRDYQTAAHLTSDGIAGKNTIVSLGFSWNK